MVDGLGRDDLPRNGASTPGRHGRPTLLPTPSISLPACVPRRAVRHASSALRTAHRVRRRSGCGVVKPRPRATTADLRETRRAPAEPCTPSKATPWVARNASHPLGGPPMEFYARRSRCRAWLLAADSAARALLCDSFDFGPPADPDLDRPRRLHRPNSDSLGCAAGDQASSSCPVRVSISLSKFCRSERRSSSSSQAASTPFKQNVRTCSGP